MTTTNTGKSGFSFILKRLDSEDSIQLNDNSTQIIGRFTKGLNLENNNFISESQIKLDIENKKVILTNNGAVNPIFLRNKTDNDGGDINIKTVLGDQIEFNKKYNIENNDVISFLGDGKTVSFQCKINDTEPKITISKPTANQDISKSVPKGVITYGNHWSDILFGYCDRPESFKDDVVLFNDNIVIIKDKYPKANHHFLTMPRKHYSKFSSLKKEDIPLLNDMLSTSKSYLKSIGINEKQQNEDFKFGFHAVPSMRQLHLHVISKDFSTENLKRKEHWNSFTTEFFIPFEDFIENLKSNEVLKIDVKKMEELAKGPLKCPKCSKVYPNLPTVKSHYATCK